MQINTSNTLKFIYKNLDWILFSFLIVSIVLAGLFWLSSGLVFLFITYKFLRFSLGYISGSKFRRVIKSIVLIIYVFVLSIGTKLFIIEIYNIPSGSMENELLINDVILVNKLIYGPKLPVSISEISWVNLLLQGDNRQTVNPPMRSVRVSGISKIGRNDIAVYQSGDLFAVKRCVAIAGDTLSIANGEVYINAKKSINPPTIKSRYKVGIKNKNVFFDILDSLNTENKKVVSDFKNYSLTGLFTAHEIEELNRNNKIIAERIIDSSLFHGESKVFALPENEHWTFDNMGPFIIPKKGLTINLTSANYAIYGKTISKYEQVSISKKSNSYYLNGHIAQSYTFKQNYCFLMGDNREEARDSRYIGFIPEESIIGKSQLILFSKDAGDFKWDRLMKKII